MYKIEIPRVGKVETEFGEIMRQHRGGKAGE
jgi:hypothetical protein